MMEEKVRRWVRADFGVGLASLDEVPRGAGRDGGAGRLWHGRGEDGAGYAVRLGAGGPAAGLRAAGQAAAHGVPGVPGPLRDRRGQWWSVRTGRRLSVRPWVEGVPGGTGPVEPGHWRAFGRLLAAVHATPVPDGLPPARRPGPMADAVRAVDRWLLRGPGAERHDPLERALAGLWREMAGPIGALLARAGAPPPAAEPGDPVLCHGDPGPGRLLLGAGAAEVWLLGWSGAVRAPREQDLVAVLELTPDQREAFFAGYGPVELDPGRVEHFRTVRALEELAVPAARVLDRAGLPEPERAAALETVRQVLAGAAGRADRASAGPSRGARDPSPSG
ncbi:aminoglycoside phosphotransferase family protein [Streptomyces cheonanensis]